MNNKGADQTARMRRLICAFVVRMDRFSHDIAHSKVNIIKEMQRKNKKHK